MRYFFICTYIVLLITSCTTSRISTIPPDIDMAELYKRQQYAAHFANYDYFAWNTSDTVSKYDMQNIKNELGAEWFGYKVNNNWIFSYGKYESNSYKSAVRYKVNDDGTIIKTNEKNESLEQTYGFMINHVIGDAYKTMDSLNIKFNWFVYSDTLSNTKQVWFLPEITQNWEILYGCEMQYVFNSKGDSLIETNKYYDDIRYYKPNKNAEIELSNLSYDIPRVNHLYFVVRWGFHFEDVSIRSKKGFTKLMMNNGNKAWLTTIN